MREPFRRSTSWLLLIGALTLGAVAAAGPEPAKAPAAGGAGAAPPATASTEPPAETLDARAVAELSVEHSRLRDELTAAEARLSLLAEKLFGARMAVRYEGKVDTPFVLAVLELQLDGDLVFRQEFEKPPSAQSILLFDGHLPPGRHRLALRLWARGPGENAEVAAGYFAGSGLAVHLREKADTRVIFEADSDGDALDQADLKRDDLAGSWDVDIEASFETEPR